MERFLDKIKDTIICSNCVEILKTLPDNCIDLTLTSPPYDNLREYKEFTFDFIKISTELYRVTKRGGVLVWVVGDSTKNGSETGTSFRQALHFKKIGFNLHDTMIYQKSGFAYPSKNRYHQIFEYMFVFSKGRPNTFNPIKDKKNKTQYTFSKKRRRKNGSISHDNDTSRIKVAPFGMRTNIWKFKTGKGNSTKDKIAFDHPAIFPESLCEDHIKTWTNPGDLVLDPMTGSGTTIKVAKQLKRHFIGIDISEDYCHIARERVKLI
ncbi:MAG: site-specific DNA-methyltransferase [Candidatus Lokiarchaeota archaeon]|nr:site-specific DNA-methyltransferase [Candidatus Lokiarchaeota archaeon]